MKKKIGIILAVVATVVISIVSLVGCAKPDTDLKIPDTQTDALMDVQANQADIAIVDGVFAGYTLAQEGNSYDKLAIIELEDFKPESEAYGIAAKKGNTNLINFINKRLYEIKDTDYKEICKKYGLESRAVQFAEPTGEWADWKSEIQNNTITIGFTIAPPYGMGSNEKPEGFDFDLAKAVFKDQGITIKGKEIKWDNKFVELKANNIDLVWNGMTIRKGFENEAEISVPYLTNEQVIVARKDKKDSYKTIENLKGCVISVEKGSAGNSEALKIFNKVDSEVFAAWLEKYPEQKTLWEEVK